MFEIGFWQLVLVAVIALVVLGPERLPVVARSIGRWTGQAKGYMRGLKAELDRELRLKELEAELQAARREAEVMGGELRDGLDASLPTADIGDASAAEPPAASGAGLGRDADEPRPPAP